MEYHTGQEYNQFILKKQEFVEEINSQVYLFEHAKLGCPLFAIKNDDINKTFSVAFNTIPTDSTGVAHILEHSVLMGSEKYPVKDVFGEINKGGLMTFLNAMTGSDITCYPFATRNIKEYFNIMDVYCDVVFKPLLTRETFEQEGWHYHQETEDGELQYQGVVYNEMKGAFSDPIRHIFFNIYKGLMPGSTYAHESGGDPQKIPDLSYEQFRQFHQKHYHASNGIFFVYGNAPLEDELQYLEEKLAAHFPEKGVRAEVVQGDDIDQPQLINETYASDSEDTSEKTFIAVATNVARVNEREKNCAFQIIANILYNSDGSPLKNRIMSSGLCKDFGGLYLCGSSYKTVMISYLVGSEPEKREEFEALYKTALTEMVENGLDHDLVLSELNKYEFGFREDSSKAQRGLDLIGKAMSALKYGMDPFASMRNEEMLKDIRYKALEEKYFEQLIGDHLIDNPATVTICLTPDPNKQEEMQKQEQQKLQSYDATLSNEEKAARVARTQELMRQQLEPNSVETLSLLPNLHLSDLTTDIEYHQVTPELVEGRKLLVNTLDTNHISYIDVGFDFSVLPAQLLPYLDIFGTIITELGTEKLNYMEFAKEIATITGGFSCSLNTYGNLDRSKPLLPMFWLHLKCLPHYLERAIELVTSLIAKPTFADRSRIREIVGREYAWADHGAQSEGYSLATARVASHLSPAGLYREYYSGITTYRQHRELALNYEAKEEDFLAALSQIAALLFNRNNMYLSITANEKEVTAFRDISSSLITSLDAKEVEKAAMPEQTFPDNEAFITSAEIVFVVQGGNVFNGGKGYNGHFEVLKTYFSKDYLWNSVRQVGGAYGCFIQFCQLNGNMILVSYRDPQVKKTYEAYNQLANVTANLDLPKEVMNQLIIGTYGGFNPHQSQAAKGTVARNEYLSGITPDYKKARLEEIISTSVDDLKSFAPDLEKMLETSYRVTIGNRAKIEQDKDLFDNIGEL